MRSKRRGFTLLEITLVCVLLVIVAAITYPSASTAYSAYKVRAATDTVRAGWADARTHAVEESRNYRFSVVLGKGNFRIAPDDPAYWSGGSIRRPEDDGSPALVQEDCLPRGITFVMAGGSGGGNSKDDTVLPPGSVQPSQYTTVAVFQSNGTSQDGAGNDNFSISFDLPGARALDVSMRGMTGASTVHPSDGKKETP